MILVIVLVIDKDETDTSNPPQSNPKGESSLIGLIFIWVCSDIAGGCSPVEVLFHH